MIHLPGLDILPWQFRQRMGRRGDRAFSLVERLDSPQMPQRPMAVLQPRTGRPFRRLERRNTLLTNLYLLSCQIGLISDGSRLQVNSANLRRKLEDFFNVHSILVFLKKLLRAHNSMLSSRCLSAKD